MTWNSRNHQEKISKGYLCTSQAKFSTISCTMGTPSVLISKIYLLTGQTRLITISCTIGIPYVLMSKIYLCMGQARLSIICCTTVTLFFWWEYNIFRCFPASSFEVNLLIFSGITERTQIVFALISLSPIPLCKKIPA